MNALLVTHNGTRLCVVKISKDRFVCVAANFCGESILPHGSASVGATSIAGREGDELLTWPVQQMAVGDELVVKVIETDEAEVLPHTRQTMLGVRDS